MLTKDELFLLISELDHCIPAYEKAAMRYGVQAQEKLLERTDRLKAIRCKLQNSLNEEVKA